MSNTIKLKRSAVDGRIPTTADLELGEIAINTYMGKVYIKQKQGTEETVVEVGGAILTFGSNPPTNPPPKHGDQWFNDTNGVWSYYIDDGNSKQWVEVFNNGIVGYTGSRGTFSQWNLRTTNFLCENLERYLVDTGSGAITALLPPSPVVGDWVSFADGNEWSVNHLTIDGNGNTIENAVMGEHLIIDYSSLTVEMIFNGSTWKLVQ